ncbi:MAG: methyltransferase domain-containing protein [Actinocatenispora sp.]
MVLLRGGRDAVRNDPGQYDVLVDEWWRPDGEFAALHWLAAARARLVPPASRPGAVLVDLGCGGGLIGPAVRGRGYRHVGVDQVHSSLPVAARHGVTGVRADAYRVPLRSGCADVVVAGEILEHVAEPGRIVAEAARLLRPGGVLVGDTIAATAVARFVAVTVAERVPGLAPRNIHDPALFVSPREVLAHCRLSGLDGAVRGLRPVAGDLFRFLATRRGPVRMVPTAATVGMYQFRAVKRNPGPSGGGRAAEEYRSRSAR